uniref:Uncharacterized protein LOC105129489 isoform X4 n=1 Tax=Rhizophora mucronata TaxID=61149 RepID=A0A2P2KML7_RHIMU
MAMERSFLRTFLLPPCWGSWPPPSWPPDTTSGKSQQLKEIQTSSHD